MIVALVTARGGSKGLPRKNILPLKNKPLISWTNQAALESHFIEEVYVSTEDKEIKSISLSDGVKCIDRPVELATDTASSIDVLAHAIEHFSNSGLLVDTVVLLQPTSPLRSVSNINEAIAKYQASKANMVISVYEPINPPIKAYYETDKGELVGIFSNNAPYRRRQDLPKSYQPNGAMYVINVKSFLENRSLPKTKVFPYLMSEDLSIDIDTADDFEKIEELMKEML